MDGPSATQFAGGGFMQSSQNDAGPSPAAGKRSNSLSLRALTVKQLHEGILSSNDDVKRVDGQEMFSVTIVGKIVQTHEEAVSLSYVIDDGTGKAKVMLFLDQTDEDQLDQRRADWRVGVYVRVTGNIRTGINNETTIVAYHIRPIVDFNEVTYHTLQCIFQHLYALKGAAPPMPNLGGIGGGIKPDGLAAGGQGGGGQLQGGYNGLDAVQNALKAVLEAPDVAASGTGLSTEEIISRLSGKWSVAQIKQGIDFLVDQCHFYTTCDENHFKSSST